jgi:hypothetical protein
VVLLWTVRVGVGTVTVNCCQLVRVPLASSSRAPQRVGAPCGTGIKHRVGDIGRRHVDLLAARLSHAVDHELTVRNCAVAQLQRLVA